MSESAISLFHVICIWNKNNARVSRSALDSLLELLEQSRNSSSVHCVFLPALVLARLSRTRRSTCSRENVNKEIQPSPRRPLKADKSSVEISCSDNKKIKIFYDNFLQKNLWSGSEMKISFASFCCIFSLRPRKASLCWSKTKGSRSSCTLNPKERRLTRAGQAWDHTAKNLIARHHDAALMDIKS